MESALIDAAERLLAATVTPATLAGLAAQGAGEGLWETLAEAGLDMVLVAEERGGLGLTLPALFPLARRAGLHALPLPLAETAMLRGLSEVALAGPLGIASCVRREADGWLAPRVPLGAFARGVALEIEGQALLVPLGDAPRVRHGASADLSLSPALLAQAQPLPAGLALAELGALAQAARIAGALQRALAMSLEHVTTRTQFGKPIAAFQAIQHQLAELAQAVQLASLAAEMGFAGGPPARGAPLAALAKARCSALVARATAIAHAVHGAMGIAAEFPLRHVTGTLHEARLAHGNEAFWQARLGAAVLSSGQTAAEFLDSALVPQP